MYYDISALAVWEIAAVVLGAVVGWFTHTAGPQAGWFVGWVRIALILFVIGVSLAWLGWPMQRAGFWLEAALLMFAGYILGCLIGGALRKLFARLSPVKKGE